MAPYNPDRWAEYHKDGYIPLSQLYYIRQLMTSTARSDYAHNTQWPPNSTLGWHSTLWYYVRWFVGLIRTGYREHLDSARRRLF